jgi:hypothetical protein
MSESPRAARRPTAPSAEPAQPCHDWALDGPCCCPLCGRPRRTGPQPHNQIGSESQMLALARSGHMLVRPLPLTADEIQREEDWAERRERMLALARRLPATVPPSLGHYRPLKPEARG